MSINIHSFSAKKREGQKLTMLTCYDAIFAKILDPSEVDMLLVGDSVAMVYHGFESTVHATMEMMEMHVAAVRRGSPHKCIIGDLPFLSFNKGVDDTLENAGRLIRAGANAVKLEGVDGFEDSIETLVKSGIPVMGHLGLTPQSIHQLGGHKVQGREEHQAQKIVADALKLESLGCFSLVLECVPSKLAAEVSHQLKIPTIGIGAGPHTDGQVLVLHDMLGLDLTFKPKFLRRFAELQNTCLNSVKRYVNEVREGEFPSEKESY